MTNHTAAFAFVLLAGIACGSSTTTPAAPAVAGFFCGGLAGYSCPPASTCESCNSVPDCGGGCRANTPCDPAKPACPNATACDAATKYCMPARTCATKAECQAGELCVTTRLAKGLCTVVPDTAPSTCGADGCPFPWDCTASGCQLFCIGGECPGALHCVAGYCTP